MDGDITKLVQILKRILKHHPGGAEVAKLMEEKSFNLNLCFFTFVPMTPEELAELEAMYEECMREEQTPPPRNHKKVPKLEFKLNVQDANFLKQNGIRF